MPTSNYQADVKVEIAWDGGVQVPMSSWTWTDVSAYVELDRGLSIQNGRQDERSTADANQLSLTFDNRDGRFTPGNTSSPYYPNVKLDVPIRVTADPVDGAISTRFVGFINEWPLDWSDGTDGSAYAAVSASSRLSRLGMQAELSSLIEQTILELGPVAYYTMGEPSGSTQANDSSGNNAAPLTSYGNPGAAPPIFGSVTGPGTDSLTAVQFATNGAILRGADDFLSSTPFTLVMFLTIPDATTYPFLAELTRADASSPWTVTQAGNLGEEFGRKDGSGAPATTSTDLGDGQTHCLAFTHNGTTTVAIYIDGALADASTGAGNAPGAINRILIGGSEFAAVINALDGLVVSHVALFDSTLSVLEIADISDAGLTGFAGETTDARLLRYAAMAGIPAAEVSAEAGQTTMAHVDPSNKQVVEMMRIVEATEGGVLFDGPDGLLYLHNRAHRYAAASIYTLNMAEQEVEQGYIPKLDRTGLLNVVEAQDVTGQYSARKVDAASVTHYGQSSSSVETASEDDDAPLMLASWLVATYKDPKERAPSLGVDVLSQVGKTPNCAAVMATRIGDKITVSNRPTQAASSSVDYFIEGWTETYGPESAQFEFNVSPSSPYDQVLVIGDATRGVIGTNMIAF